MFKKIDLKELRKDKNISNRFLNAEFKELDIKCNIYKDNFFIDSFNYYLISEDYKVFEDLFSRDVHINYTNFFTKNFYENFNKKVDNFKNFSGVYLLGSNAANNYYSNLIQFLPRIFFNNNKKIRLGIHRNSSIKFRNFIEKILNSVGTDYTFVYLDDDFYSFTESEFPQFFNINNSIKILKKFLQPREENKLDKKIYITRENASYRKIVNEADIIPILRSKGYKVINPELYEINEQIKIFAEADKIISPHGSNLSNIIFCKPGTEIYELGPQFDNNFEVILKNRYKVLADYNNLKYKRMTCDIVPIENHSDTAKKYINNKILFNSNYYKNLVIKLSDIRNID